MSFQKPAIFNIFGSGKVPFSFCLPPLAIWTFRRPWLYMCNNPVFAMIFFLSFILLILFEKRRFWTLSSRIWLISAFFAIILPRLQAHWYKMGSWEKESDEFLRHGGTHSEFIIGPVECEVSFSLSLLHLPSGHAGAPGDENFFSWSGLRAGIDSPIQ